MKTILQLGVTTWGSVWKGRSIRTTGLEGTLCKLGRSSVVEHLPSKNKTLNLTPSITLTQLSQKCPHFESVVHIYGHSVTFQYMYTWCHDQIMVISTSISSNSFFALDNIQSPFYQLFWNGSTHYPAVLHLPSSGLLINTYMVPHKHL